MPLLILGVLWAWGVIFMYFAQSYALPIMGLDPLNLGQYFWVSFLVLIALAPSEIVKALAD